MKSIRSVRSAGRVGLGLLIAAGLALSVPALAGAQPAATAAAAGGEPLAQHAPSGKSLVVPEAHKALGTVYYALPGRDRQVFFISDTPVERIEGQSNGVIGYTVAGQEAKAGLLAAGEWHLPVSAIKTGNRMRDSHMAQEQWLDAESHPNVVFRLRELKDVTPGEANGSRTYTATLVGEMTIKGVTKKMEIPDTSIVFLPASEKTAEIAKGDLLGIRCKYDVRLEDFGVSNRVIVTDKKVAEVLKMDTTLYMSTVPPEEQGDSEGAEGARHGA